MQKGMQAAVFNSFIHSFFFAFCMCDFVLELYCRLEKNEFLRRLFGAGEYEFYCSCHVIQFNGTMYYVLCTIMFHVLQLDVVFYKY